MNDLAKILFVIGGLCFLIGFVLLLAGKIPWLGRLPGDIYIKRDNFSLYFPLMTSILISILISLILMLLKHR